MVEPCKGKELLALKPILVVPLITLTIRSWLLLPISTELIEYRSIKVVSDGQLVLGDVAEEPLAIIVVL
jgi:hypothetical protein